MHPVVRTIQKYIVANTQQPIKLKPVQLNVCMLVMIFTVTHYSYLSR